MLAPASVLTGQLCLAQTNPPVADSTPPADDWKPAASNQPGQQHPQVNSERYARFSIFAPQAQIVGGGVGGDSQVNAAALKQAGINCVFYVSPNTAHEWLSLYNFAPLLFRD